MFNRSLQHPKAKNIKNPNTNGTLKLCNWHSTSQVPPFQKETIVYPTIHYQVQTVGFRDASIWFHSRASNALVKASQSRTCSGNISRWAQVRWIQPKGTIFTFDIFLWQWPSRTLDGTPFGYVWIRRQKDATNQQAHSWHHTIWFCDTWAKWLAKFSLSFALSCWIWSELVNCLKLNCALLAVDVGRLNVESGETSKKRNHPDCPAKHLSKSW